MSRLQNLLFTSVALTGIFLSGCSPKFPTGLKEAIQQDIIRGINRKGIDYLLDVKAERVDIGSGECYFYDIGNNPTSYNKKTEIMKVAINANQNNQKNYWFTLNIKVMGGENTPKILSVIEDSVSIGAKIYQRN